MANIFKEYSEMAKKKMKPSLPPLFSETSFKRYFNMYNAHQKGLNKIPAKPENIKMAREELTEGGWSNDQLIDIAEKLLKGYAIDAGGYSYKPNKKLNVWTASDGSVIRKDLLGFILDYTETNFNIDGAEWGDFFWVELIPPKKVPEGQEEYEYGKMRGDYEREDEPKEKKVTEKKVKPIKPVKIFKSKAEFIRWWEKDDPKTNAEIRKIKNMPIAVGSKEYKTLIEYLNDQGIG